MSNIGKVTVRTGNIVTATIPESVPSILFDEDEVGYVSVDTSNRPPIVHISTPEQQVVSSNIHETDHLYSDIYNIKNEIILPSGGNYFKNFVYLDDILTQINIYLDNTLTELIYTIDFEYVDGELSKKIVSGINGTIEYDFIYDNGNLISINKILL